MLQYIFKIEMYPVHFLDVYFLRACMCLTIVVQWQNISKRDILMISKKKLLGSGTICHVMVCRICQEGHFL